MAGHFTAGEIDAEFPPSWEVMPKDSSGKEIVCHVVDLQQSDPEYKKVETAVINLMPPPEFVDKFGPELGIVSIQRIQNPSLYVQYASRKKIMDKENPEIQIERWLYYKCSYYDNNVVKNICDRGFNKSIACPNCKC